MADIRINALATTATASASDDYLAIDGTANGTRKLSAYSPTFGGNVAANGTLNVFGPSGVSASASRIRIDAGSTGIPSVAFTQNAGAGYSSYVGVAAANGDLATGTTAGRLVLRGQNGIDISSDDGVSVGFKLNTSNAATLAGNLTVSGTSISIGSSASSGVIYDASTTSRFGWYSGGTYVSNSGGTISLLVPSSGNLLLGTTTDSSNGKLQLATHTTSAGGIGFGTETALYRQAAGALSIDHIGGSVPVLNLSENGTIKAILQTSSGNVYLGAINTAGASLFLRSGNNTTALTLDSSQRTILSGALRLNNAYTASVIVPTGYVTIQDSTGTTYKVAVSL